MFIFTVRGNKRNPIKKIIAYNYALLENLCAMVMQDKCFGAVWSFGGISKAKKITVAQWLITFTRLINK